MLAGLALCRHERLHHRRDAAVLNRRQLVALYKCDSSTDQSTLTLLAQDPSPHARTIGGEHRQGSYCIAAHFGLGGAHAVQHRRHRTQSRRLRIVVLW